MTTDNPFMQAALEYAGRGWRVFPCAPGTKMPHRGTGGVHEATTDPEKIIEWWTADPKSNVAIRGGNGMVIVDADCKHGKNGVKALEAMGVPLDTLSASTPSGGRHYYFASMEKFVSSQNAIDGVDVRSEGTYVLAEPSVIDGRQYYFDDFDESMIAPLPKELSDVFKTFDMRETDEEVKRCDPPLDEEMDDVRQAYADYLTKEAEPAIEGEGGHSKLLKASLTGVHGFQLPNAVVKGLLWKHYNPRCAPQWDPNNTRDVFEFERKVDEAAKLTPKNIRDRLADLRRQKVVEQMEQDVHFQPTSSGAGRYYMRKEDGEYVKLTESLLRRHLVRAGMSDYKEKHEPESEIGNFILDTHLHRNLVYAGNLAGFDAGVHILPAGRILSLRSPVVPEMEDGDCAYLLKIIYSVFDDDDNRNRFLAWFYHAWRYLHRRSWSPLPVVALAGPANSGKSLIMEITRTMLGDTPFGDAYAFLCGEVRFNNQLAGSHLLRVDDAISSFDMRVRRAFGANVKQMAVLCDHQIEPKGVDAVNLSPHWRVMIATNDEPESLQVLPPIDDGMQDKVLLLRIIKPDSALWPEHPDNRQAFREKLVAQIPALLHWVSEQEWVDDYKDTRQAVTGWQDPVLMEHLHSLDDHRQLLELIDMLDPYGALDQWWEGTAAQLEAMLKEDVATRQTAQQLLRYSKACGSLLGRLSREKHGRVVRALPERDRKWRVYAEGAVHGE